ncbi:hypothetical protein M378DRAFT_50831, partial [Amanita muscaria Koide BX008]
MAHWRAIPRNIFEAMKEGKTVLKQKTLDGVFELKVPKMFTKETLLDVVTKFIVCDDQALLLADKPTLRNCLVIMRPKMRQNELPSSYEVSMHLHNKFVDWMKQLKAVIAV